MKQDKVQVQAKDPRNLPGVQKDLLLQNLTRRTGTEPIPCDFLKQSQTGCSREWTEAIEPTFPAESSESERAQRLISDQLRMGIELETFMFESASLKPLGSAGAPEKLAGGEFLKEIAWALPAEEPRLICDNDVVYGLFLASGISYSLEPGGQLEIATPPRSSLAEVASDLKRAFSFVEEVTKGRVLFLSHGTNPLTDNSFGLQVPKKRYRILTRYLASEPGGRGIHMMRHATTVQPNIDVGPSAKDWADAVKLSYDLSPFFKVLFPNSYYFQNRFIPDGLERQRIWSGMDASRTGVPSAILTSQDPSCCYAKWATNAFVFLIDGLSEEDQPRYGELRFCDWFENGYKGTKPSLADWERHLATLFPEIRLRRFLELRMFDAQPFEQIVPLLAFVRGLLQSVQGRQLAIESLARIRSHGAALEHEKMFILLQESAKQGLHFLDGSESGKSQQADERNERFLMALKPSDPAFFGGFKTAREFVAACGKKNPSQSFDL